MDFTYRSIGLMISGFMCLTLAAFVFWQYRKRRIARVLASFTFFVAGYCWLVAGLAGAKSESLALLWLRIFMPFAYLLGVSFFRFSMVYSRTDNRFARGYMKFAYGMVFVLSLIKFLNLSNGARYVEGQGWFPDHDPVYSMVYAPFLAVTLLCSLGMVLVRIIKSRPGLERNNLLFYFLAIASAIALDTTQLFRPLAFLATFAWFAYVSVLSFAITRHRLFDLSLVVKRGAMAAGITFILTMAVAALILKAQEILIIREIGFGNFAVASTALLVTAALLLVSNPISRMVNRMLGIRVISLEQRLLEYSGLLVRHVRFNEYVEAVTSKLETDMGLSRSWVLLKDRITGGFSPVPGILDGGLELLDQSSLATALTERKRPLELEELISQDQEDSDDGLRADLGNRVSRELETLGVAVAVPIWGENGLGGILMLGPKVSGALFNTSELDFVQALAVQVASALDNWALHSQVQQAERLSTLGTLSASLAHELRNPLTSISTFVQMMPTRFGDEAYREKFGRIVGQELTKLTRLTEQLLNFSRPASSSRTTVNLLQLCNRTRQLLKHQFFKKNVTLEIVGNEEDSNVQGIESELSQVIINLLINALQATANGGRVTVRLTTAGSKPILEVSDSGSGMTPEQMRHIFEPFYTTKEGGTGLGLPTCQRILEQHGGDIEVRSVWGEGSVFTMNFPAAKEPQTAASAAA